MDYEAKRRKRRIAFYAMSRRPGAMKDPFWQNVVLMVPFTGPDESTNFIDRSSSPATLTGSGNAKIDTLRYADGSLILDRTQSGSRVSSNKVCAVGSGPFTMEAYVRPLEAITGRIISAQDSASPNAMLCFRIDGDGRITTQLRDSTGAGLQLLQSAAGLLNMNDTTEYHIAWTRDQSNLVTIWLNGVSVASGVSATNPNASRPYWIGAFSNTSERISATIRWLRVTEGACRYTEAFTPPSIPLPVS